MLRKYSVGNKRFHKLIIYMQVINHFPEYFEDVTLHKFKHAYNLGKTPYQTPLFNFTLLEFVNNCKLVFDIFR